MKRQINQVENRLRAIWKILNGLLDELRHEFTDLQDDLENQLVKHEMTTLSMNPKFKRIEQLISRTLEKQNSSLSELNASFRNIDSSIVGMGTIGAQWRYQFFE